MKRKSQTSIFSEGPKKFIKYYELRCRFRQFVVMKRKTLQESLRNLKSMKLHCEKGKRMAKGEGERQTDRERERSSAKLEDKAKQQCNLT